MIFYCFALSCVVIQLLNNYKSFICSFKYFESNVLTEKFFIHRLTLLLSCAMKFESYPHDTQTCTMKIESCKYLHLIISTVYIIYIYYGQIEYEYNIHRKNNIHIFCNILR